MGNTDFVWIVSYRLSDGPQVIQVISYFIYFWLGKILKAHYYEENYANLVLKWDDVIVKPINYK